KTSFLACVTHQLFVFFAMQAALENLSKEDLLVMISGRDRALAERDEKIEYLESQLAMYKRMQFGQSRERFMGIYVGARGKDRLVTEGVELLPLEFSSLSSDRAFVDNLKQELVEQKIDVINLNAAIPATDPSHLSDDVFQLTFDTNHLAHYLLAILF